MIFNPNNFERNSRSNSNLPPSNNFYLPNLKNSTIKQKSSLSVIPQRNSTFDNLRGREQMSPFGSPHQDFDRSIYDRDGRLVGMSAKDSSILARSRNETFLPMNNDKYFSNIDSRRNDSPVKSILHKLLVAPENEKFKLNAKTSSMGVLEGMYKDAANDSTQKNQKTFEWKQFLDQQIIERRAQKELEMKQNQERDAIEEEKINKYLQSSTEDFAPSKTNPFRTKEKFNPARSSIHLQNNLPQLQSPIKRQNPFDRSRGSLKGLASDYFPDPTTTAHYALNNKIDELKHDLFERQRALMDQLKGLKKDADLSSKLRNLAVKGGPELNASSVMIQSQPVDILERFIQRNGGYEEWAKYTGWKSDLLKNYFNIQRAKGGNLENLGIKGLITEEDMDNEEFILGIKQQFIDISSKGHVHKFVANAMKSRPGSRMNGENLDYMNYEVDENNQFTGGKKTGPAGGNYAKLSSRIRGHGDNRYGDDDKYDEEENKNGNENRELQSNSMKVKGKPARFFGNPFRNNEGNPNELNEGEDEFTQQNGYMGKHFDNQNEDEYEEGDDYEYKEGMKDENENIRGRSGKIMQGKSQRNRERRGEDNEYEEEDIEGAEGESGEVEGKVGYKNGKGSSKGGIRELGDEGEDQYEQGDRYKRENDKAKTDKTKKMKIDEENEKEREDDQVNNQKKKAEEESGGEGQENSSGSKGKKKSKKVVRFGENQINGIEESAYEDEYDEEDENKSDELSNEEETGGAKKDKAQSKVKDEIKNDKIDQDSKKVSTIGKNKSNQKDAEDSNENSQRKSESEEISSRDHRDPQNATTSLNSIKNKKKQTVAAGKAGNQAKNNPTHNNDKNNKVNITKNGKQLTLKKDENTRRDSSLSPSFKLINEVEEKVKRGRELLEEGEPQLYAKQHYQDFLNNMEESGKANYRKQGENDSQSGVNLDQNKMFQEKTQFVNTNQMSTMEFIQNTEEDNNDLLKDSQIPSNGSQVSNEDEPEEYGNNPRPKKVVIPKRQLGEGEGLQEEPERGHARKRTLVRKVTEITPLKVTSPLTTTTKSAGKLNVKGRLEVKGRTQGRTQGRTPTLPGSKY